MMKSYADKIIKILNKSYYIYKTHSPVFSLLCERLSYFVSFKNSKGSKQVYNSNIKCSQPNLKITFTLVELSYL